MTNQEFLDVIRGTVGFEATEASYDPQNLAWDIDATVDTIAGVLGKDSQIKEMFVSDWAEWRKNEFVSFAVLDYLSSFEPVYEGVTA